METNFALLLAVIIFILHALINGFVQTKTTQYVGKVIYDSTLNMINNMEYHVLISNFICVVFSTLVFHFQTQLLIIYPH